MNRALVPFAALILGGCTASTEPAGPAPTQSSGSDTTGASVAHAAATTRDPRATLERVDTSQRLVFPAGMASAVSTIPACHRVAQSHHDCPDGFEGRVMCDTRGALPARCQAVALTGENETAVCCAPLRAGGRP